MSYEKFEIIVDREGKVHIKTNGFFGDSCIKEAEKLISLLKSGGMEVKTEKIQFTSEYYKAKAKVKVRE